MLTKSNLAESITMKRFSFPKGGNEPWNTKCHIMNCCVFSS